MRTRWFLLVGEELLRLKGCDLDEGVRNVISGGNTPVSEYNRLYCEGSKRVF